MSYDIENVAADFIRFVRLIQQHIHHERHAMKVARALEMRVRIGLFNYAIPEAQPQPVINVQPWFYGWDNDVLYHEINHVLMWWSGLEEQIRAEYGDEDGWKIIENLCNQAVVFLRLPQPLVDAAIERHGISAAAVQELQRVGRVSASDALRRLVYDQPEAQRAGFIIKGGYVAEVALCNFGLPFGWLDFVPKPALKFPADAKVSYALLGGGGLIGVCGES